MQAAALLLCLLAAGPPRAIGPAPGRPAAPRTGTVIGVLRHKACQSFAAGASVAVIGREASATSDAAGRFSLTLPPGSYSLVIRGPNLGADQRVDDVAVPAGHARDLGVVEVWPEERPPNCGVMPPPPAAEPVVAVAPDTPSVELPGTSVAPAAPAPEQILLRGSPGTGPGQFGLQGNPARDDEDALGPPSFAVGPHGNLFVLDSLNGRVVRFDGRGRQAAAFPLVKPGPEPVVEADMAVSDDGTVFVFTQGDVPALAQYDAAGRMLVSGALPPSFKGVDFLFGRQRPIFLMQNGQAVRAELGWGGLRPEGPLPGLPMGELFAGLERVSRWRAAVRLLTADGRVRRSVQLHSQVPVTGLRLVGVNRRGEMVVAVDRAEGGDEAAPHAEVLLLSVTPQGFLTGAVAVPRGDRRFEFREFALAPDGAVIQMQSDAAEVRFVRWILPPPPRESVAGEGIVKGRVLDGGRPAAGAAVTAGKGRRASTCLADGSFELRLPPGSHVVSIRGAASGETVERRVAVAAGATVDLGNVLLPPHAPPVR